MTKDLVQGMGHSPVCQILLQIIVRAVIRVSQPARISPAGIIVDPRWFSFLTQPPLPLEGWGSCLLGWYLDSLIQLLGLHWCCGCTAEQYCSVRHFPDLSWMVVVTFPVSRGSQVIQVGKPSYCCSCSDYCQSVHCSFILFWC